MQDFVVTKGIILKSEPYKEYDRRVVILTTDYGKITAFANGARRPSNRLLGATDLFCFGEFKLFQGKNSYTINDAHILNYFESLRNDFDEAIYGMYFLEVMDYMTRENNDERDLLKLLYQSLRALINDSISNRLAKCIFEIKTMALMGEYREERNAKYLNATKYTVDFILKSKVEKLYTFTVSDEVLDELSVICTNSKLYLWNHEFKSEEMLKVVEM